MTAAAAGQWASSGTGDMPVSPPVSGCVPAVPGASQSPWCHRAGSGCQQCQWLWRGAVLGCTGIFHQSVITGAAVALEPCMSPCYPIDLPPAPAPTEWQSEGCAWHPCPHLHPGVPATTIAFLPWLFFFLGQCLAWETPLGMGPSEGAHLGQGSRVGAGGSWVPQEGRH